jgi:hypothetical protein
MSKPLNPTLTNANDDGSISIHLRDDEGSSYEVRLPTIQGQSLAASIMAHVSERAKGPKFENPVSLAFHQLQLETIGEKLFVRLLLSRQLFHEYWLPLNTTLAQALLATLEAQNQSKVNHLGSGQTQ